MPRKFIISNGQDFTVSLAGFSRDELYGEKSAQKRDATGKVLQNASLSSDGLHIFVSGGLGNTHLDADGTLVTKMKTVDLEGKDVPLAPSMYNQPKNELTTVTLAQLYTLDVMKTYVLEGENLAPLFDYVKKLNAEGTFPKFTYAYFDTPVPLDAVLIAAGETVIVLLGRLADPQFFSLQKIAIPDSEEGDDEDEEIDFNAW